MNILNSLKNIFSTPTTPSATSANNEPDHWGAQANLLASGAKPSSWSESPLVMSMYINPAVSGKANVGWLEAVARTYYETPVERALSLGCGGGALELQGAGWIAKNFDGFDASEGAIELATRLAREGKKSKYINYETADLNKKTFDRDTYDAVFASQSVHHIEALEHYMQQVVHTLKKDGLFVINEFVGPSQFQWTEAQLFHANRLLNLLPDELRMGIRSGIFLEEVSRPTIAHMNEIDPTEAIRSGEITEQLEKNFEIVEKRDFGGTLLHLMLNDIAGNFTGSDEHLELLRMLFSEEQRLIAEGEIISDFTLIFAKNSKLK